jgi:hypothetical protein
MDLTNQLLGFYGAIASNEKISSTHISLYMAILKNWIDNQSQNPVTIKRDLLMKSAKISSRITYNHCMWDLHDYEYIRYEPSFNFFSGSVVYVKEFDAGQLT